MRLREASLCQLTVAMDRWAKGTQSKHQLEPGILGQEMHYSTRYSLPCTSSNRADVPSSTIWRISVVRTRLPMQTTGVSKLTSERQEEAALATRIPLSRYEVPNSPILPVDAFCVLCGNLRGRVSLDPLPRLWGERHEVVDPMRVSNNMTPLERIATQVDGSGQESRGARLASFDGGCLKRVSYSVIIRALCWLVYLLTTRNVHTAVKERR